jgi:hypothetical protein
LSESALFPCAFAQLMIQKEQVFAYGKYHLSKETVTLACFAYAAHMNPLGFLLFAVHVKKAKQGKDFIS